MATPTIDTVRLDGLISDYVTRACPDWTGVSSREGAEQDTKVISSYTRTGGHAMSMAGVPFSPLQVNELQK